jgi:predicted nucleotide-binding protein
MAAFNFQDRVARWSATRARSWLKTLIDERLAIAQQEDRRLGGNPIPHLQKLAHGTLEFRVRELMHHGNRILENVPDKIFSELFESILQDARALVSEQKALLTSQMVPNGNRKIQRIPEPTGTEWLGLDEVEKELSQSWEEELRLLLESRARSSPSASKRDPKGVFIVHGHKASAMEWVQGLLNDLGLRPIVLKESAKGGQTVIEKFEEQAASASFAVVLLTPDDEGRVSGSSDWKHRARQNVIFEMGYFFSALGRKKICILKDGEIDEPSNFRGVAYINLNNSDWRQRVATELQNAGLAVDSTRIRIEQ